MDTIDGNNPRSAHHCRLRNQRQNGWIRDRTRDIRGRGRGRGRGHSQTHDLSVWRYIATRKSHLVAGCLFICYV